MYPFEGDTVFLLFENISKGTFSIPPDLDPKLCSLLRGMLSVDQDQRFSVADVKRHEWVFHLFYNFPLGVLNIMVN